MMEFKSINKVVAKKDSQALVTGQPVYTEDIMPKDCLIVKVLRSPHARAIVKKVNKSAAEKIPGIVCIVTADDVPKSRFTIAGQTYPEPSPYDRLILDKQIRFVGDAVALVAGTNQGAVDKALRAIHVEYEVQEPLLDFTKALDNDIVVHPEDDWKPLVDVGGDNKRNLVAKACDRHGDIDAVLDRLPTAKILGEENGTYRIEAEVYGKGVEMWLHSQGKNVSDVQIKEI